MSIYDKLNRTNQLSLIQDIMDHYGIHANIKFVSGKLFESAYFRKKYSRKKRISNKGRISNNPRHESSEVTYAEYLFDTGDILLNSAELGNKRDFLLTVLHELKHVEQSNSIGKYEFQNKYTKHMDAMESSGLDGYDTNPYEIEAEAWAKQELSKWL